MRPHPSENKCIAVALLLSLTGGIVRTLSRAVASFLSALVVFIILRNLVLLIIRVDLER